MGDIALRGNKLTARRRGFALGALVKAGKKIGRLSVGKKSHIDTSAQQKLTAKHKKEEIKNKEAREEWAEVNKLGKKLKTGAKIGGAGIGTTVVAGKVKEKLKKKDKK